MASGMRDRMQSLASNVSVPNVTMFWGTLTGRMNADLTTYRRIIVIPTVFSPRVFRPCTSSARLPQGVRTQHPHVVGPLERDRLRHLLLAHAPLHLADGLVFALRHPRQQAIPHRRQVLDTVFQQ